MANVNVTDDNLRYHVLSCLSRGEATAAEIAQELYGTDKTGLDNDVANQGKVFSTLLTLKAEHRAYPVGHAPSGAAGVNSQVTAAAATVDSKWQITSKGRKTYG